MRTLSHADVRGVPLAKRLQGVAPEVLKHMNWDRVEGNWKQIAGQAREQWGKLTDNDLQKTAGRRDQLVGLIQERYGIAKDEAERQANEWAKALKEEEKVEKTGRAGKF
jgi:uncharacterized protein YjbJ (UPF0337 family)